MKQVPRARMRDYTTFRIGGPVRLMLFPETRRDVLRLPEIIAGAPFLVMTGGSNLVCTDADMDGVVVNMSRFQGTQLGPDVLAVRSGHRVADIMTLCLAQGIGNLSFLAGIPGCVGGMVCMNAGAFGDCLADWIAAVEYCALATGRLHKRYDVHSEFYYRGQTLLTSRDVVLTVLLRTRPGRREDIRRDMERARRYRRQHHPCQPSAGSVFKNPKPMGMSAGQLIERAGLKSMRRGGAQISPLHGNFIVNTGDASFADVRYLIDHARDTVLKAFGLLLEPEVKIVGGIEDFQRL